MHKRKWMVMALLALILGLYVAPTTARAQEPVMNPQAEEKEQAVQLWKADQRQTGVQTGMLSQGSLVYKEEEHGVQIYAADFLILKEKLDTIPDMLFEPACYTHVHQWEYRDVNEKTHTRHCESCGNGLDLVRTHKAERREECVFSHDGAEYFGIRYTCACGYQWEQEKTHTLFFETMGEDGHRIRCRLDGTKFCPGYEPFCEEHYAYYYEPCEDGCHHEKICMDCGYRGEEECFFSLPDAEDEDESGSGDSDSSRRCWCGNIEKLDVDIGDENTDTETDEENTETMPGEEKPDEESGEENTDEESGEKDIDTEAGDEEVEVETEEENADEKSEEDKTDAEMVDGSPNTEPEESGPNEKAGQAD